LEKDGAGAECLTDSLPDGGRPPAHQDARRIERADRRRRGAEAHDVDARLSQRSRGDARQPLAPGGVEDLDGDVRAVLPGDAAGRRAGTPAPARGEGQQRGA